MRVVPHFCLVKFLTLSEVSVNIHSVPLRGSDLFHRFQVPIRNSNHSGSLQLAELFSRKPQFSTEYFFVVLTKSRRWPSYCPI